MTTYYVDNAGSNTAPYDTWAKAANALTTIAALDAAGDVIYVAHTHAESTAGAVSLNWAGTLASPTKIICGNTGAQPPTASATTATVATTTSNAISVVAGGYVYLYGIAFTCGSGANGPTLTFNSGGLAHANSCDFILGGSSGGVLSVAGSNNKTIWENCRIRVANVGNGLSVATSAFFSWKGGSIIAGGSAPNTLFANDIATRSVVNIEGIDLSNGATAMNIIASTSALVLFTMRNCKMPASWSGSVNSSTPGYGSVFDLYNCDSAATNYKLWRKTQYGSVRDETTIVKTSGATDGTTPYSWKMVSVATPIYPHQTLDTPEFWISNDTTGASKTVTLDIVHDSVTNLKDSDIWFDVQELGSSAAPVSTFISSRTSDILATGADLAASSATWTTTGMTNPNKQKMSVTFTPQLKGVYHAVVHLAKVSYTVYVDGANLQVT